MAAFPAPAAASAPSAAVARTPLGERYSFDARTSVLDHAALASPDGDTHVDSPTPGALADLLRLCGQRGAGDMVPMEQALAPWLAPAGGVTKLADGTYAEAFKCGGVVLKVRRRS